MHRRHFKVVVIVKIVAAYQIQPLKPVDGFRVLNISCVPLAASFFNFLAILSQRVLSSALVYLSGCNVTILI